MITIYHNPRCSKSRDGLCFIEKLNVPFEIVKYLENTLTKNELIDVLKKLNYSPIELVRTNEKIWIESFKNKNLHDDQIIDAMINNPKLIERPIIVNGDKAIVARPLEKINEIL